MFSCLVAVAGNWGRFPWHYEGFPKEHTKGSGRAFAGMHLREEGAGSRQCGGGVTVDIKSKIGDSEVARQGLWEILPLIGSLFSWCLSLDPCRDHSGGAWRRSFPTSMPTAVS